MKTIIKNYEIKQFSTFNETIKLFELNGTPTNITNWVIYGRIENFYESDESMYIICTKSRVPGQFTIGLSNISTSELIAGTYPYDIVAQTEDGTVARIQSGTMTVTYGVANPLDAQLTGNGVDTFLDGGVIP